MPARSSAALARWRRTALRELKSSRAETLAVIARLPDDAILRPRTQDEWSVKDTLAHFMACDEETVRRLKLVARGEADRIAWFESMAHANRFNAKTVKAARRLTLPAVLRRMKKARTEMIEWFARLPTPTLRDPSHRYPITEWLPAPGWSHERDHVAGIKDWWRATSARRPVRGATPSRRRARA